MRGTWPLRIVCSGWTIAVLAPFLSHLFGVPPIAAMGTMLCGVVLALVGAIAGFAGGVRHQAGRGWAAGFAGVIPAVIVAVAVAPNAGAPRINDITTNDRDPPLLRDGAPYPADFVDDLRSGYPDLRTVRVPGTAPRVFGTALAQARSTSGWTVVAHDETALTIHAEARTLLFGFVDDVAIRLRRVPEGQAMLVDLRSRSRVGQGDLGANARRIRAYLTDLRSRLSPAQ